MPELSTLFTPTDDAARQRLVSTIEAIDPLALGSVLGGLLLIPDNLHHVHRFEALASLVLAGRSKGRADLTRTRARRVVDELAGAWVGRMDDPWPTLACEAFVYHGGTHLFIPGGIDTIFILRALARAIEECFEKHEEFAQRATRVLQFACGLSDDLLTRVGATRNQRVPPSVGVVVPPNSRLRTLRDAVHLTADRLGALCRETAVRRADVERFCTTIGSITEPHPTRNFEQLTVTPLARRGDEIVVVAPHLIGEAAVRNVLALADEAGARERLAREFHQLTYLALDEALKRLGLVEIGGPRSSTGPTPGSHVLHALYQCDRDKMHHVMLASDALDGDPRGAWDTRPLGAELAAAREGLGHLIAAADPPVADWTSIVVAAGIGRDFEMAEVSARSWGAAAADVEVIAHSERRNPLLFWKFMEALEEVRPSTKLMSWSPLDTFAFWKSCGERFSPDDEMPNVIGVPPDMAEVPRYQAASRRDWHAIESWRPDGVIEVAVAEDPERPVYAPRNMPRHRLCLAIETAGPVVWVITERESQTDREGRRMSGEVLRMAAFWVSEFGTALALDLTALDPSPPVVVELDLLSPGSAPARGYAIEPAVGRRMRVVVTPDFYEAYDDTNRAEREFASEFVTALLTAAGLAKARDRVAACLDRVAPVGVKRMLHAVRTERYPSFIGFHELPPTRYLSDFDAHRARRIALGSAPTGAMTLDASEAHSWLNAAVGRLYATLREQLSTLDAADAMHELLRFNEALVHEDDERDMTFASVLACAEGTPSLRRDLEERIGRHARAATATRFLIEHVAAESPSGTRKLSGAEFDQLLAIAAEIIALGMASDAVEFELASATVKLGTIGYAIDLGGYEAAMLEGRERVYAERLDLETARVLVPGAGPRNDSSGERPMELDLGMQAEFGRDLRGVAHLFGEALALASERGCVVVEEPSGLLVERFASRLGWSEQKVRECLEHFILEPRSSFLKPGAPHDNGDIWPWRFNRGLSYLRRPFVRRPDDIVSFSPGQVSQSSSNLLMLLLTGRYKARSNELKRVLGRVTRDAPREFVEEVAAILRSRGFIARAHVSKIGRRRIEKASGQTAGDVDVLAAHPESRRVLAIECKDIQLDRIAHEISNDLKRLFIGSPSKASAQALHLGRLRWLREHQREVVEWLVGEGADGWSIDAAIVTSRALMSPLLGKAELPVWTLGQLRRGDMP